MCGRARVQYDATQPPSGPRGTAGTPSPHARQQEKQLSLQLLQQQQQQQL
jgi:hypothetical protein